MHMLRENEKKVDRGKDGNPGYRKTLLYVVTTYKQSLNFIAAIFVFIVAAADTVGGGGGGGDDEHDGTVQSLS